MLDERRRASFAGRDAEIAVFRKALGTPGVIFVHGPGGVGKTALLGMFAHLAAQQGHTPVRIDARHLTLGRAALPAPDGVTRPVLLIDTYELLEPVDDWVRETYLPSLPGDCLVVIAGRTAPRPRWRADPACRVLPLDNLPPDDVWAWLAAQEVPAGARDRIAAISRGHPLTLSMLVDAVRRGATPRTLADLPDLVGALIVQLVDEAPSPRHRAALEVCAHAPVTTEDLLHTMVGGDVGEVFAWLRGRAFIEESPHGLYPHDVVRDLLDADLRWRDPARYADLHRRKLAAFHQQVTAVADERERLQILVRTVVLNGFRSGLAPLSTLAPTMGAYADGLTAHDHAPIEAMTAAWQGAGQAGLVVRWMRHRPGAFRVFRTAAGELCGYTACLDLTEADLGVDPGVDAMWRYASALGPLRPGEQIRAWRFFLDRDHGQRPSPSLTLFLACQMLDILQLRDDTAWSLVAAFEDAALWAPTMEFIDFWPAAGVPFPLFAHDWRRVGVAEWTEVLQARQLGATVRRADEGIGAAVLSRDEFTDAVRSALRHLHTPDLLRTNPLVRSRLVRRNTAAGDAPVDTLRRMIETGAAASELLTRTFVRPATSQERVAAALHLSFNTYRRHRDRAVADLVAALWKHETH